MAISQAIVASLLVSFLVLHFVQADEMMYTNGVAHSLVQKIGTLAVPWILFFDLYPLSNFELCSGMRGEVFKSFEAEDVQEGMRDLLPSLQLRTSRHFRQQKRMRPLLRQHENPRWQAQVPVTTTPAYD
ncbi:hypothetical protein RJ639_014313 [Escallonia herrerae]|uniref:Transmembrane protein n=1 Tax=Escallonia herrerae TaxID=1293975 RepID=A0AA88VF44_9ASTE|nr:hypothetical protein RJ639_014313 [Escallonia herrerae]